MQWGPWYICKYRLDPTSIIGLMDHIYAKNKYSCYYKSRMQLLRMCHISECETSAEPPGSSLSPGSTPLLFPLPLPQVDKTQPQPAQTSMWCNGGRDYDAVTFVTHHNNYVDLLTSRNLLSYWSLPGTLLLLNVPHTVQAAEKATNRSLTLATLKTFLMNLRPFPHSYSKVWSFWF